ncbi:hypothetical protein Q5P01_011158 [Channa striata]|uniref:RRM domain-containing protein n=1 Tax=Channa striata TaxID=64152 RepID=A0AA88SVC5_CHASR|nr:hypothetical protein Q5P01_011158 [Channa striata]
MAVVIRLQGLRITAGSEDIRKFFTGLKIPDGGVHIIGGEREEAFIIFASDEDARRAMTRSGGVIKGSPVSLLLSSKAEMQNMLERSTKNVEPDQKRLFEERTRHVRRSLGPEEGRSSSSRSVRTPSPQYQRASKHHDDFLCVYLRGMPYSVTERDIREFFSGLLVDEIIVLKNAHGSNNGKGLVKFATREDATESLKRDMKYMGTRYIEVSRITQEFWRRAVSKVPVVSRDVVRGRSPIRIESSQRHHGTSQLPLAQKPLASSNEEYCVFLDNLSYAVEKQDIKKLFHYAKLQDDQILYLNGGDGRRTRSAFVLFRSVRDYCDVLAQEKRLFFNRWLQIRPISRENMITILESQSVDVSEQFEERHPSYSSDNCESEKMCIFVRNLPFDVRKVEIMDFFHGFNITEDKVLLLHDHKGAGVGKALVLFRSEAEAVEALSLNGRRFLGSEVILKCISSSEMEQLAVEPPTGQELAEREPLRRAERYSGRSSEISCRSGNTGYTEIRIPRDGNIPGTNVRGGSDYDPYEVGSGAPHSRSDDIRGGFGTSVQRCDGPTCVKLVNLPFQIRSEEVYDFCYGYRIIPGSVSLLFDQSGKPKGSATVVFESRQEALSAIKELSGRPVGPRKVQLVFV